MVYPTLRAPFAELYTFSALIGSGVGSTTYHVTENATGRTLLLKHISIPTSQKQVQALIYSGAAANEDEAKKYFQNLAEAYRSELELTRPLQGNPAVRLYDNIQIDEKEQEIGYDVYLICTPMTSLGTYLEENAMTQLRAVNLAIDLCTSAEALRTAGLLNYNVKPSNIFLNDAGHFVFGDLGFVRIDELEYSSMPDSQFCSYSAPEFSDLLNHLNLTADIYSIGMILYRIFNGNHGPFVDEQTSPAAAEKMRLSGASLPAPLYADYELAEIILKACAFHPENRYDSPAALKQALIDYRQRNQIDDLLIVPPIISDPDSLLTKEALEEVVEPVRFADLSQLQEDFVEYLSPIPKEAAEPPEPPEAPDTSEEAEVPDTGNTPPASTEGGTPDVADPSADAGTPLKSSGGGKRKTVVLLASIAVVIAMVAAGLIYYLRLPVEVYTLQSTERNVDSITVSVDASAQQDALILVCADAYGNTFYGTPAGEHTFTFEKLSSNTPYTITVESAKGRNVTGTSSITVSTLGMTEILSFDVQEVYENGVELALTASGPEPITWSLEVTSENEAAKTVNFSGHSVRVTGLTPGTEYTFTLKDVTDYTLQGTLSCTGTTLESVTDVAARAVSAQRDSMTLEWTYAGADTAIWSITYEDESGNRQTLEAENMPGAGELCSFTVPGLEAGKRYTFSIQCVGMAAASVIPVTATVPDCAIAGFDATATEQTVTLQWSWEETSTPCDMVLTVIKTGDTEPVQKISLPADGATTCTLENLEADATYQFVLCTTEEVPLPGASSISVSLATLNP